MHAAPHPPHAPDGHDLQAAIAQKGMLALVAPERVRLRQDAFRVLFLKVDDREYEDVRPVRVFPVSLKADYISFLDRRRAEVALVTHPHRLDPASRETLERALSHMYYVPKILRVDSITETWGVSHWQVQTDRGYASFEIVDREHIRRLPNGRFLLQDADGNRFEIEALEALDKRSQLLVHSET
jgi:hypothetical protein